MGEQSESVAVTLGRSPRTMEQVEALFGDTPRDFWRRTWPGLVEAALTERGWHPDNIRMACAAPTLAMQLLDEMSASGRTQGSTDG